MLTSNDIRVRLRKGQATVGTWLQIPSPDVAEIIARMGYDWAAVDMEHGSFSHANLPDIFRALERWGTLPFARLPEASMRNIKDALDSGARGLIFPMIESREQLDKAIAWSLFPGNKECPSGKRGVGFSRANGFGRDFNAYVNSETGTANDIVLVAQIEHVNALGSLDAIFTHPRLDAYMIGPYDLSASMGCTGRFDDQEFLAALALIEQKAALHKLPKGYHVVTPDPELARQKMAEGYAFIAYGIDALFLQQSASRPEV